MNQEIKSTLPAEEILSQAISPEKKQELIERLNSLKSTLNQVESKMNESQKTTSKQYVEELDRRLEIISTIGYETRNNIDVILKIQLSEKYHPALNSMLKNLDKVNTAHGMILDGLMS
jgi:uncharacterized coiled-coil DUF342 family protein